MLGLGISGNMAVIVSTSSSVIFFGLNPNARAATLSGSLDGVEDEVAHLKMKTMTATATTTFTISLMTVGKSRFWE